MGRYRRKGNLRQLIIQEREDAASTGITGLQARSTRSTKDNKTTIHIHIHIHIHRFRKTIVREHRQERKVKKL